MKKRIFGNWKMNGSLASNAALLELWTQGTGHADCEIAVCAPAPYLSQLQSLLSGSSIAIGAQDVSAHASGAFTGEVSAAMLREFGVRYGLVGHSERRQYHAESDEMVARKAQAALANGFTPGV